MAILKSQYESVKDPLTTVSAKVPESLQRALKTIAESLDITVSQATGFAIERYVDGILNADLALELKQIAGRVSVKSEEIFAQNTALLANQVQMMAMLKKVLDDDLEIERLMNEVHSQPGDQS